MKKLLTIAAIGIICELFSMQAEALTTNLTELAIYNNGTVNDYLRDKDGSGSVTFPTITGFNTDTGLGTISYTLNPGTYTIGVLLDHEIDLLVTGYWPESGTGGTFAGDYADTTWQIGEPYFGSIYGNFSNNQLTSTTSENEDDLAMALMRSFTVASNEIGYLAFHATTVAPDNIPYLTQTDMDPDYNILSDSIYLYSTLTFRETGGGPEPVPEPSTFVLLGSALAGLGIYARRRRNS